MYKKCLRLCGCIILLICGVACGINPQIGAKQTATPVSVKPIKASYRPYRVIQICLDTPPLYSAETFTKAAKRIADWIEADVAINQDGFMVYVGEIRSKSFQVNVMNPIQVPPIPNDQPEPTPQPGYTPQAGENGYHVSDIQSTVNATNNQNYADWQAKIKENHATVASALQEVQVQTNKLRNLDPNVDRGQGADIYGCLADAGQHFKGTDGKNEYLIIASAFVNNTDVDYDPTINLAGAKVFGIYRDCSQAAVCAEHDKNWKNVLTQLNANPNVTFLDPDQSDAQVKTLF